MEKTISMSVYDTLSADGLSSVFVCDHLEKSTSLHQYEALHTAVSQPSLELRLCFEICVQLLADCLDVISASSVFLKASLVYNCVVQGRSISRTI